MFSTLNGLWDFKDVNRRIFSNNVLLDNAFNIAKDPKKKKTSGSGIKNENISNKESAEKLQKPIIKNY